MITRFPGNTKIKHYTVMENSWIYCESGTGVFPPALTTDSEQLVCVRKPRVSMWKQNFRSLSTHLLFLFPPVSFLAFHPILKRVFSSLSKLLEFIHICILETLFFFVTFLMLDNFLQQNSNTFNTFPAGILKVIILGLYNVSLEIP